MPTAAGDGAEWLALRVEVPEAFAEVVANFLLEAGAPAVITGQHDLTTEEVAVPGRARLEASVPAAAAPQVARALDRYLAALRDRAPELGAAQVEIEPVPALDWMAVARAHHRPMAVGRRLMVAPPWDVPPAHGREVLVIEPGMAFGTGQHATTRGCLEAIEEVLETGEVAAALDVGTGSGVLAAALARLGVARVVALDADPTAVVAARHNLVRNAARVLLLAGPPAAVRGRFDLVVANLLADALVDEAVVLAGAVAPGGRLIVSGLLAPQVDAVVAAYPGWRPVATRAEEAWRTLTLARAA